MSIQTFSFNQFSVSFQENGYLNATAIAEQYDKRVGNYLRNERTQEYITALNERLFNPETRNRATAENQLVIIKKGGNDKKSQGTWLHPKLAVDFARWLNPKFAVWCDEQIEALLNGKVSDNLPAKTTADDRTPLRQAVAALVGRKGIDYSTAYGMVHQRFNVGAIEDIPAGQLPEAVAYVHALTLSDDRQPLLDGLDIEHLAVTVYYGAWALEMLDEIAVPLKQLGHPKATTMHTLWAESRVFLRHNVQTLRRILPALEPDCAAHVRGTLDKLQRLNARFI